MKAIISILLLALFSLAGTGEASAQKLNVQGDTLATPAYVTSYRDSLITEAHRYILSDNLTEGEKVLWQILYEFPRTDVAYYHLYTIYMKRQDAKNARMAISKAREIEPENYWYNLYYAILSYYEGNTASAIAILEDLQSKHPDKIYLYYHLLNIYTQNSNADKALETIDKMIELEGENERNGLYKYELLLNTGKLDEAFRYITELSDKVASPEISLIAGDMYEYYDQDSLALIKYDQAISMDRNYPGPYNSKLAVFFKSQNYEAYLRELGGIIENRISSELTVKGINILAQNLYCKSTFPEKIDSLVDAAVRLNPADTTTMEYASWYYVNNDQKEKAIATSRRLTETQPELRRAWDNYIYTLNFYKEHDRAIGVIDSIIPLSDEQLSLYETKALIYYIQEKPEEAVGVYESNILPYYKEQNDEENIGKSYMNIGDILMQSDLDRAIASYKKAVKYIPEEIALLNNYAYCLSLKGKKLKLAEEMSRKAIEAEPENATYLDTYGWVLHRSGKDEEAKKAMQKAISLNADTDATLLDHFAEILYALEEHDLAFMYWMQAASKDPSLNLSDKISQKKNELKLKQK